MQKIRVLVAKSICRQNSKNSYLSLEKTHKSQKISGREAPGNEENEAFHVLKGQYPETIVKL